ncbi:MAG: sporulation protein YqfD [Clostridia bacterium]|nr:sporulation protein YqfD [Clostridia bacterium]
MLGKMGFYVESLSAHRAAEKLVKEGVEVLSLREVQKNVLDVHIRAKDGKKAFAILRGSCYNITNVRYFGLERLRRSAVRAVGLIVGAVLFWGAVAFAESRVLKVHVVGSGAFYEREILSILAEANVKKFSAMPRDTGLLTASILALPRVEFCSFKSEGGVLTVEVRCSSDVQPIAGMPLLSPADGVIEELIVVRGTPLFSVGDEVEYGVTVVGDFTLFGEREYPSLVIAKVTVAHSVCAEYELEEKGALAQAYLDYGALEEVHISKTERGWLVEGIARSTASINLE